MFWNKKNKSGNSEKNTSTEIARQDPRTKVRTTVAQTATTNTTVQNATIINDRAKTVTYQTTTQTVTHQQKAGVTEIETRHTATPEELELLLAQLNLGATTTTTEQKNLPVRRLISKYDSPSTAGQRDKQKNTNSKPTAAQQKLQQFKTEETTVTEKRGRTMTTNVQEYRIKLNPTGSAATNMSFASTRTAAKEPYTATISARALTPLTTTTSYTSPYTQRTMSIDAKPFATPNNYSNLRAPVNLYQSTTQPPQLNIRNHSNGTPTSLLPTAASSVSSLNNSKSTLKPGCLYIFNNERFDDKKNEYRVGSSHDVKALRETFEAFKFKVEIYKDLTVKAIRDVVEKIKKKNFTNHSCVVIVILSHGDRFDKVLAKNEPYNIDDVVLFPILRNGTLNDKPKIFFIQACKGGMEIGGVQKDFLQPHGAPSEVLKCYSTFEGYVSYRTASGSLFVQELCANIKRDGHTKNIEEIMKEVTRSVKKISNEQQIPTLTSNMTKPLVFGDYV